MAVWLLNTGINFTQFFFPNEEDKKLFHELAASHLEESKPVLELWPSMCMLRGEPKKHPDFFEIDETDVIAISQKAVDNLDGLKNIELLPIDTDAGKYYAMNVLNFVDCLDKDQSEYIAAKNGTIVSYSLLEFDEEKVEDAGIFRIPQLPYQIFLSGDIEEICEQKKLSGLSFDPETNLIWYPE